MKVEKISLEQTQAFKGIFIDYINQKQDLKPFFGNYPDLKGIQGQIENRSFPENRRQVLVDVLNDHYKNTTTTQETLENIESLKEKDTYTITTGHQLNIFTGPLYFIYKIVTVINLAQKLRQEFPDKKFVPVYWMAGEDHDYDEIKYFNLFGKKYIWETKQSGPVGQFSLDNMDEVLREMPEKVEIFENAYRNCKNLADATFKIVNELFGKYGLVIVNANNHELKSQFAPVIKDELLNNKSNALVEKTADKLAQLGYTTQVYPRNINLFYIDKGIRERILQENGKYVVKNTNLVFSEDEILDLVEKKPEKFSPNVVLRPLFQETILPNIAYIGGPSEVAYWLQLKDVFEEYKCDFPLLIPRNFALVIQKNINQKIEKLNLDISELFLDFHEMKVNYISKNADDEISIEKELDEIMLQYEKIKEKASKVDKSLEGFIGAESSKTKKGLENISKRIRKSEERKQETELNQLESVKDKLFPNGSLQERNDNFLNFYINNHEFIDELINQFDPLDYRFNIIRYND